MRAIDGSAPFERSSERQRRLHVKWWRLLDRVWRRALSCFECRCASAHFSTSPFRRMRHSCRPVLLSRFGLACRCFSEQGRSPKPPVKPNQDSFVALEALGNNPQMALFGVFDGHGPKGEDASNYCRCGCSETGGKRVLRGGIGAARSLHHCAFSAVLVRARTNAQVAAWQLAPSVFAPPSLSRRALMQG
jgi:hypothetical protein